MALAYHHDKIAARALKSLRRSGVVDGLVEAHGIRA
jgi:hypothetical protein